MLTQITQTFAPDGLSGGHAPAQGRFQGSNRQDVEYNMNNHHDYDDGLVHSHSWASSSHNQPLKAIHKSSLAAV